MALCVLFFHTTRCYLFGEKGKSARKSDVAGRTRATPSGVVEEAEEEICCLVRGCWGQGSDGTGNWLYSRWFTDHDRGRHRAHQEEDEAKSWRWREFATRRLQFVGGIQEALQQRRRTWADGCIRTRLQQQRDRGLRQKELWRLNPPMQIAWICMKFSKCWSPAWASCAGRLTIMITSVLYDVSCSDFCTDRYRYAVKFAGNRFRAGAFFRIFNFHQFSFFDCRR